MTKIVFCFFGFLRDGLNFENNFDIKKFDSYLHIPTIYNEDRPNNKVDIIKLKHKYGSKANINLYNYNKQIFIDKAQKLDIPRFNQFYQQAYRIFSFFYNIKSVLEMLPKMKPDDIIILSRVDIGLKINNFDKVRNTIRNRDIFLGGLSGNGTDDKWFVLKYKNINVFKSLYNKYEEYLVQYNNPNINIKLDSTRPEDVFKYHFVKNNMNFIHTGPRIIYYHFKHVCSLYCGHNKENTKQ
jgi:hypothetical protein